jgi:hypothetical protein
LNGSGIVKHGAPVSKGNAQAVSGKTKLIQASRTIRHSQDVLERFSGLHWRAAFLGSGDEYFQSAK